VSMLRRSGPAQNMRTISVQAGEHTIALTLPAEQADALEELIENVVAFESSWSEEPEAVAARLVGSVDEDDDAVGFAKVMLAHNSLTHDVEGPLRGAGMFMVARRAVSSDLASLLLWLHDEGHLDESTAEALGLRPGYAEELFDVYRSLPQPNGADDFATELAVRGAVRRFERQLGQIIADTYPDADGPGRWRLRHLLVEFAQANELDSLDVAHRLLRAEHPQELEFLNGQ
jgi:hypothetical protein